MVLEATGNALAIARIIEPHVAEVVLAHAQQARAINHARVKTNKILGAELAAIDRLMAVEADGAEEVRRLLTIPGVDVTTFVTLLAVIGDVRRFPELTSPQSASDLSHEYA